MTSHEHTWVDDEQGLAELAVALDGASSHAIDTESNSGFVYEERLCLLQFNVNGRIWLVDLMALPQNAEALDAIRFALEDGERTTLLHGGEFDVGCLKRDFDLQLGGLWDSQQAAAFLGWEKTGYASLVESICDVRLDKGFSHYDWGRRPIGPEPLRYAVEDVFYLPIVCERLREAIRDADLEEELAIANQSVMDAVWGGGNHGGSLWRIKGVHTLPADSLPVAAALDQWRDAVARRRDRPPGRVLNNRLLLALSRTPPRNHQHLRRLGVHGRLLGEHGGELLAIIAGARRGGVEVPSPPAPPAADPQAARRGTRLKEWRRGEAQRRGVPERVVLPPTALRYLAAHGTVDLAATPQLGSKRITLYGAKLVELCAQARKAQGPESRRPERKQP